MSHYCYSAKAMQGAVQLFKVESTSDMLALAIIQAKDKLLHELDFETMEETDKITKYVIEIEVVNTKE